MRRAAFLPGAVSDLASIRDYVARESGSIATAQRFTDRLRARCHRIASLPGTLGQERPDLAPGLRSVVEAEHLILFRYHEGRVQVVRILHGRRDLPALFKG